MADDVLRDALALLRRTSKAIGEGFWEGSYTILECESDIDDFLDLHDPQPPK